MHSLEEADRFNLLVLPPPLRSREAHADARFLLAERRDWLLLAVSHGPGHFGLSPPLHLVATRK
jgi:hypothetical protein